MGQRERGVSAQPSNRNAGDGAGTRIDSAHVVVHVAAAEQNASDGTANAALDLEQEVQDEPSSSLLENLAQVHVQADELASHLRRRQESLDHREAQLNARLAALDQELRSARLWLEERDLEQAERANQLEQRAAELAEMERTLLARIEEFAHYEQENWQQLQQARHALDENTALLARRQAEAEAAEVNLARDAAAQRDQRQRGDLQDLVERVEAMQQQAQAELAELRRGLEAEREEIQHRSRLDRQRLADQQRRAQAELQQRQQAVERQSQQLDRRRLALEQSRVQISERHRETLEMRLATEELWSELTGSFAPAVLTRSLAHLRARLADHYRLAGADVVQSKTELDLLRAELVAQVSKLQATRHDLSAWSEARQAELDSLAERLAAREQEQLQAEAQKQRVFMNWQAERFALQQEIRRLSARLLVQDAWPPIADPGGSRRPTTGSTAHEWHDP